MNLRIPAGHHIALVGTSGSGKSTVFALLERFYEVLSGSVLVDGRDLREYDLFSLRSRIGIVSQEPPLFVGTIADSCVSRSRHEKLRKSHMRPTDIKFGRPEATMEEVIAAAKVANAHDFILEQPMGYDTYVGESGLQLSGGQKQA